MRPRILVVGATGQQGGAAARHLLHGGFRVRAFVRDSSSPQAISLITSAVSYGGLDAEPFVYKFAKYHAIVGNTLEGSWGKCNANSVPNELEAFWNSRNLLNNVWDVPCSRAQSQESVMVARVEISRKPDDGLIAELRECRRPQPGQAMASGHPYEERFPIQNCYVASPILNKTNTSLNMTSPI